MSRLRPARPRVVIVASSSADVRRRYVEGLVGHMPVVEVTDRGDLAAQMAGVQPLVLFLDQALPGLGGLGGVPGLRRLNTAMKIVLLADPPNERDAVFALVAGARGYCGFALEPALILKATDVVQRGEVWIGRHVVPHLLSKLTSLWPFAPEDPTPAVSSPARFDFLAPREREIALLVGAGGNNREIALRLNISEATVKAHLTSVYRKLRVSDRLRLALFVTKRTRPPVLRASARASARARSPVTK